MIRYAEAGTGHRIQTLVSTKSDPDPGRIPWWQTSAVQGTAHGNELKLLRLAAALEQRSEHPLAEAVVNYAKSQEITAADINQTEVEQFQAISGAGSRKPGIWSTGANWHGFSGCRSRALILLP